MATALRCLRPAVFWRSLKVSHPVRWGPLCGYLLLGAGALYGIFCLSNGALLYAAARWRPRSASAPDGSDLMRALLPLSQDGGTCGIAPGDLVVHFWAERLVAIPLAALFGLLCAAGFAALPISRRIARVRWTHIGRVAIHGLALLAPATALIPAGTVLVMLRAGPASAAGWAIVYAGHAWVAAFFPMQVWWWKTATGLYLRMDHAWGAALAISVMALLATLVVPFYLAAYG